MYRSLYIFCTGVYICVCLCLCLCASLSFVGVYLLLLRICTLLNIYCLLELNMLCLEAY
jgi:hypothetical protein